MLWPLSKWRGMLCSDFISYKQSALLSLGIDPESCFFQSFIMWLTFHELYLVSQSVMSVTSRRTSEARNWSRTHIHTSRSLTCLWAVSVLSRSASSLLQDYGASLSKDEIVYCAKAAVTGGDEDFFVQLRLHHRFKVCLNWTENAAERNKFFFTTR